MYESHITVNNFTDEEFKLHCKELGVKPVIIEDDTGSNTRQTMTARFHRTGLPEALFEMNEIANYFGDNVIRRKLEKIISKNSEIPPHLYLEFHLKFETSDEKFASMVEAVGGHSSRNIAKNRKYQFATVRTLEGYERLKRLNYHLVGTIRECVVYDDNPGIDSGWCGCECGLKMI